MLPERANRHQRKQSRVKDLYVRTRTQHAGHALVWFAYHSIEDFFAVTRQSQHALLGEPNIAEPKKVALHVFKRGIPVAQFLMSRLLAGGRFRIHTINGVGRRKGRIIEVEVIATGEHFYGSARRMERLVRALQGSDDNRRHDPARTPGRPS